MNHAYELNIVIREGFKKMMIKKIHVIVSAKVNHDGE